MAVTCLNLSLTGVRAMLTSSSHFLPTGTSASLKYQHQPQAQKPSKTSQKVSLSPLPCLFLCLDACQVSVVMPMYKSNASPHNPQSLHIDGSLHGIRIAILTIQTLTTGMELLLRDPCLHEDRFLDVPVADISYHSVSYGEAGNSSRDTATTKLGVKCLYASLSIQQILKLVFMFSSWRTVDKITCPLQPLSLSSSTPGLKYRPLLLSSKTHRLLWIFLSLADMEMSMSRNIKFTSLSTVFGMANLSVAKHSSGKNSIPVLFGPLDTANWNKVESFQCQGQSESDIDIETSCLGKKLAELLISFPQEDFRGTEITFKCMLRFWWIIWPIDIIIHIITRVSLMKFHT